MPIDHGQIRRWCTTAGLLIMALTGPRASAQQDSEATTNLAGAYWWKATACFVFVYAYDAKVDSGIGGNDEVLPGHEEHTHFLVKEAVGGGACVLRQDEKYRDHETACTRKLPVLKRILSHIAEGGSPGSNGGVRQLEPLQKLSTCPVELVDDKVFYVKGDYRVDLEVNLGFGGGSINICYEEKSMHLAFVMSQSGGCCGSFWSADLVTVVDTSEHDAGWQNDEGFKAYKEKAYERAIENFRNSVALDPTHKNGNFNLACTLSILKKEFAEIQKPLEALLAQPKLKTKYCKKITKDSDLKHYRDQPAYQAWHAKACGSK